MPNAYYPGAVERPLIVVQRFADGHALADGLEAGEVDVAFHLPIDRLSELRRLDDVRVKTFEVGYHYMMFRNVGSNSGRPIDELAVRQAIDVALDRDALSQALAGGRDTRSLFLDYTSYYQDGLGDSHGDEGAAEALFDAAGWTLVCQ